MIKLLSLFSGIGAFEKALRNLAIDHETVAFSEIDIDAENAYCAIHNMDKLRNIGDISAVNGALKSLNESLAHVQSRGKRPQPMVSPACLEDCMLSHIPSWQFCETRPRLP